MSRRWTACRLWAAAWQLKVISIQWVLQLLAVGLVVVVRLGVVVAAVVAALSVCLLVRRTERP